MEKQRWAFGAVLVVVAGTLLSCGSEDAGAFGFSIYASPQRSHAPVAVSFELMRDDGGAVDICSGVWRFGDGVVLEGEYEAEHTYRKPGKYRASVELACGGQKGTASADIEIFDPVDLRVSGVDAKPINLTTSGKLSVAFQMANLSSSPLRASTYADIYLIPSGSVSGWEDPGAVRIYRHAIQALPEAGSEQPVENVALEIALDSSIRTGIYDVGVVLNADRHIGETAYDNNFSVSAASVTIRNQTTDGADFEALQLQIFPEKTFVLTSAMAQFQVVNHGATTDESFHYQIWMGAKDNALDLDGGMLVHESTIQGGLSGIEQTFKNIPLSIAPSVSQEGLYYFWLILDSQDEVRERDETNNRVRSSAPVQVAREEIIDADIIVENVIFTPASVHRGSAFTVDVGIYNQGSQPTGSFVCTVFLSEDMSLDIDKDQIVGSLNIDDLRPNEGRTEQLIVETDAQLGSGEYWVYVFCDSTGVVNEASEDNNIQRSASQITITGTSNIDLLFGQNRIEKTSLLDGEPIQITASVCNKGKTDAGPFYVEATRLSECSDEEVALERKFVEGLAAGACQILPFQAAMSCEFWCPFYRVRLDADVTQIVQETTKANNSVLVDALVTVSGKECVCESDIYEPNNLWSESKPVTSLDADLSLCRGDIDYYKLSLKDGASYEIYLSHLYQRAPLYLSLYRGTELISSHSGGDEIHLSGMHVEKAETDPLYIAVGSVHEGSGNAYHLKVDTYQDIDGIDLAVSAIEIHGTLNAADAVNVSYDIDNLGSVTSPQAVIGWYVTSSGSLDGNAVRIAGQTLEPVVLGNKVKKQVALRLPSDLPGGSYRLVAQVDDERAIDDVRRSNNIAYSDPWQFDRSCYDALDPNGSIENARRLDLTHGAYVREHLTVCQGQPDYYRLDLEDGQALEVSVTNEGAGDFDIYLLDRQGNVVASSQTGNVVEKMSLDLVQGNQDLYVKIEQLENVYNETSSHYTLSVKTKLSETWVTCTDPFEPNNFSNMAADLYQSAVSGKKAQICPTGDEDYYTIHLVAGDRLQIGFRTSSDILRAALYARTEGRYLAMLTNLSKQTLDYMATAEDDYDVRVFTNASLLSPVEYEMVWLGILPEVLSVSEISANQDGMDAPLVVSWQVMNHADVSVRYRVSLTIGGMTLYEGEDVLAAQEKRRFLQKIVIPATLNGNQVLQVTAVDLEGREESSRRVDVLIAASCENDVYEPNDNILRSTALSGLLDGMVCPGDEDWYAVEGEAGKYAKLSFTHADGDLQLYAYDDAGNQVDFSDTAEDEERVTLDGVRYLRVRGASSQVACAYRIEILGD